MGGAHNKLEKTSEVRWFARAKRLLVGWWHGDEVMYLWGYGPDQILGQDLFSALIFGAEKTLSRDPL